MGGGGSQLLAQILLGWIRDGKYGTETSQNAIAGADTV